MDLIRPCLSGQTDLDYDSLAEQGLLIVGRPDSLEREYGIQPETGETGQTLTLKIFDGTSSDYRGFTVGAVLDQSKISSSGDKIDMLMLPMDVMEQLTSANTLYQLAVRISDGKEAQAEAEIDQILNAASGLEMMSLSAAIAQNENFIQGMKLVLAAAVALIGCFAIMNLIHTILTGVIVRQKEHTLMRCVGMGQNQLCSMVLWESLMTSGIGLVFSMLIGGGVGAALCSRLKNGLMTYLHYRFPVGIAVALAAFLISFAAILSVSVAQIRRNQVADTYEAVFTGVDASDLAALKDLPEFARVGKYYLLGQEHSEQGYNASHVYCDSDMMYIARSQMELVKGELPAQAADTQPEETRRGWQTDTALSP